MSDGRPLLSKRRAEPGRDALGGQPGWLHLI